MDVYCCRFARWFFKVIICPSSKITPHGCSLCLGDFGNMFWIIAFISWHLVGGWTNPSQKYARQNGFIFPKKGRNKKKKHIWNHNWSVTLIIRGPVPIHSSGLVPPFFKQTIPTKKKTQLFNPPEPALTWAMCDIATSKCHPPVSRNQSWLLGRLTVRGEDTVEMPEAPTPGPRTSTLWSVR